MGLASRVRPGKAPGCAALFTCRALDSGHSVTLIRGALSPAGGWVWRGGFFCGICPGPGGPGGFNGGGDGGAGGLCLGSDFQEFPCESGGPGGGGASDVTAVLPGKVFQRLIVAGGGGAPGGGPFPSSAAPRRAAPAGD